MSGRKCGRPRKIKDFFSRNLKDFEPERFKLVIYQLGGNAVEWSLKREWVLFFKTYFGSSTATVKQARSCYDYFRRNIEVTGDARFLTTDPPTETEIKKEAIFFPKLKKIENSIVIINSSTNTDNLARLWQKSSPELETHLKMGFSPNINLGSEAEQHVEKKSKASSSDFNNETGVSETPTLNKNINLGTKKEHCPTEHTPVASVEIEGNADSVNFQIPSSSSIDFPQSAWDDLYSRCAKGDKDKIKMPNDWTETFSEILSKSLPYCCINFKRHKFFKKGNNLFKCWYYCSIEDCELNGIAILDTSFCLHLQNLYTALKHTKNRANSFKSRNVKGGQRKVLAESVADLAYPSKIYHRRLAALDDTSFQMGNLKNVPQSKNVITQCSYENRKSCQIDKSALASLKKLKSMYDKEMHAKHVPGFIQFISIDPLTIGLWTEKDIELFHNMSKNHSLVVDATGSMVMKMNGTEVFYFAFLSFDRSVKTEPVPHLEILTDRATSATIEYLLASFLEDEKKRYGYTTSSVPILCITDVSWPIIKSLIACFNKETLEENIDRSFRIASGVASHKELPTMPPKTFVHLSLCHVMKAFAKKIGKCFTKDKEFITFAMSVLVNAGNLADTFDIYEHIFVVLLSKYLTKDCLDSKQYLSDKMTNIEEFKYLSMSEVPPANRFEVGKDADCVDVTSSSSDDLPVKEDTYLQQCKRRIYYTKCSEILDRVKDKIDNNSVSPDDLNSLYSPKYASYLLDNWTGLTPLWTAIHLGDQGRHGSSDSYKKWSIKFNNCACVVDPPKAQGIVEFHHKSAKHIVMNSKRQRADGVVSNLYLSKKSKLRQLEICKSRQSNYVSKKSDKVKDKLPNKISTENWRKKKQHTGPGYYQTNQKVKKIKIPLEEWEKVPIIPWGGNYIMNNGTTVNLVNTCPIDNFLQILLVFYSLNIEQMQNLFDVDNILVAGIRDSIQLLLTSEFAAAKYHWLTEICNLNPNLENKLFNSFGTDKQLIMHPLNGLFRRTYEAASCSSNHCPVISSSMDLSPLHDMTLHIPDKDVPANLSITQSIKEWELGISTKATISCKGQFDVEPRHGEFICESVGSKDIIRCAGWKQPESLRFETKVPFLLFDISQVFRDRIDNLSCIPTEIRVYGETYKLGGATSYVQGRQHYVGYICISDQILLYYDGLPSSNPKLIRYEEANFEGDISLICYFPYQNHEQPVISLNSNIEQSGHEDSDHLLAKALYEIENENIYKKPRGKSFRKSCKMKSDACDSIDNPKIDLSLPQDNILPLPSLLSPPSPSKSISSIESSDFGTNLDMIEFINRKKEFILSLISDRSYSSEFHLRSERMIAFRDCKSLHLFEKLARKEFNIIAERMEPFIGKSFTPYARYTEHIHFQILTETRYPNPDDICDLGGIWPIPFKIGSFSDKYKTIDYIILPELFTEFIMESKNINYKEASRDIYLGKLPTTHHISMLENDRNVILQTFVRGVNRDVILQIVEDDITRQYTHSILNITDKHLAHNEGSSISIVNEGGSKAATECERYIDSNGPLDIGEVVSLSPGNLRCYFLIHSVWADIGKPEPNEDLLNKSLRAVFSLSCARQSKSMSIPAINYSQVTVNRIIHTIITILSNEFDKKDVPLNVIRLVSKCKRTLQLYRSALRPYV